MERNETVMQFLHKTLEYKVVVNREKQYSIWPVHEKNPLGWKDVGVLGSRNECFAFIESVWTGARPLSLQRRMGSAGHRL